MRKILAMILAIILAIPAVVLAVPEEGAIVLYIGSNHALVNDEITKIDENISVVPILENDRTFLPVRFIAQALGMTVDYDDATRTVTLSGAKNVSFVIGQNTMTIDGNQVAIDTDNTDVVTLTKNERTFLPVRALSEAVGKQVFFHRGLIIISDNALSIDADAQKAELDSLITRLNGLPVVGDMANLKKLIKYDEQTAMYDTKMYKEDSVQNAAGGTSRSTVAADVAAPMPSSAPVAQSESLTPPPSYSDFGYESDEGGNFADYEEPTALDPVDPGEGTETDNEDLGDGTDDSTVDETIDGTVDGEGDGEIGNTDTDNQSDTEDEDDYSKTNTQVEGVDEADIVKTDGRYIYQINGKRIVIAGIKPVEEMAVINIIDDSDDESTFYPTEMYVDGDKLVVIGNLSKHSKRPPMIQPVGEPSIEPFSDVSGKRMVTDMIAPVYFEQYTHCAVYNIADRANPIKEHVFEIEGNYISSRKMDNYVYLVTNKYVYVYGANDDQGLVPTCRDTAVSDEYITLPLETMCYLPNAADSTYMTVASIDIDQPSKPAEKNTVLGAGSTVYMSTENMYVATYSYENEESGTKVYKFAVNSGYVTYTAEQTVPGNILNQFSMDEYLGNFRIATTTWDNQTYKQSNNLFILDAAMNRRGEIRNIAPDESIYSTRFVGNRGYMVTFRQVDPLFVIDLEDIDNPTILGQLKIPGYSNYLHPVDENHILGFGKEAEVAGEGAYYQGMKMALFDVSDVANPVEKFTEQIGDRGTDSALLWDHKALLFDKNRGILAFPVSVSVVQDKKSAMDYGKTAFVGAYVYNFGIDTGFSLTGKITHLTDADFKTEHGYTHYDNSLAVDRILYANGTLFTTSQKRIQANDLNTADYLNHVDIPADENLNNGEYHILY